jgi:hypothetical protein
MLACTKCGNWHTNAERAMGRNLSCTEVKRFWGRVKGDHRDRYGHPAQITTDDAGNLICFTCKRQILLDEYADDATILTGEVEWVD